MKKLQHHSIIFLFVLIYFTGASATQKASAEHKELDFAGVWYRGREEVPKNLPPNIRGFGVMLFWKDVEATQGKYDWSAFDDYFEVAEKNNLYVFLRINVGPDSPQWIYEHGVPKVFLKGEKEKWPFYPYYYDPKYKKYFVRLINAFGDYIEALPPKKRDRVVFVQAQLGSTGDDKPWSAKGKLKDPSYSMKDKWSSFKLWGWGEFIKAMQNRKHPIAIVVNGVEDDENSETFSFMRKNARYYWGRKGSVLPRGHHLNPMGNFVRNYKKYFVDPQKIYLYNRAEMDQTWRQPFYQLNVPLNFYWGAITALNGGLQVWDVTAKVFEYEHIDKLNPTFKLFNKYAGQTIPKTASSAFCVFHKGLDITDTDEFPVETYGKASRGNIDRYIAICKKYEADGASLEDPKAATEGQVTQRRILKGFNDAGYQIWRDNYTRFLYQIDADETSRPKYKIGGPITPDSPIYSRFGRSFDTKNDKHLIYLALHKDFFGGKPLNGAYPVKVTIIYYDKGTGAFALYYDAVSKRQKRGAMVRKQDSGTWKRKEIIINDGYFGKRGRRDSDLMLYSYKTDDTIFHVVEVQKMDNANKDQSPWP